MSSREEYANSLQNYWDWLNGVDPRLKKIFLDLDDEMATGRVGARQNFDGDLIYRIYVTSTDHDDFVSLYTASFERSDNKDYEVEHEARCWWNVLTQVRNDTVEEIANHLMIDVGNKKEELDIE